MTKAQIYQLIDKAYRQMSLEWKPGKPKEIFEIIQRWRRKNNFPQEIEVNVSYGCLYLNGEFVERIAYYSDYIPRYGKRENDEAADYYEELILARQEEY